jgi:TonB-linked SusC/RagA family outer membrane protein
MEKKSIVAFKIIAMKMIITQLLIMIFVFTASAKNVNGQEMLDKRVSLTVKNEKIKDILQQIQKITEAKFVFSSKAINAGRKISFRITDKKLSDLLREILFPLDINYKIINGQIILFNRYSNTSLQPVSVNDSLPDDIPVNREIIGKVTDPQGEPLAGVSVFLAGTKTGTTTDSQGQFDLSVPDNADIVLELSFVGYQTTTFKVGNQKEILIRMTASAADRLNEVVLIGYGSVKRSDVTGAVSSISADQISQVKAVSTVAGTLQGQAAGVQVIERSGQPGDAVSIKVRGTNSIAGGNDVLYVVDGLPLDGLSAQLNPSDIQSIEVLKDASATAIYGSRGANGVVLITTKKGRDGKIRVSYNGYLGLATLRKKIDLVNAREFANLQNEANTNWNLDNPLSAPKLIWSSSQIDSLSAQGTDWQDMVYRKAPVTSHDISVSGGNTLTKFYTSLGYFDQDGIIRSSGFKRYSFRGNLEQKISNKLTSDISLSLQQSNYSQNNYYNADGGGGVPFTTMVMPPTQGVYDAYGNPTIFTGVPWGQTNPYTMSLQEYNANPSFRLLGNVSVSYAIFDGLKLKVSAGVDNTWSRQDFYAPRTLSIYSNGGGYRNYSNSATFVNENLLNFNKTFNRHNIDAVGGISYQSSKSQYLSSGTAQGFLTDIYQDNNLGAASVKPLPGSGNDDSRLVSYLGRVNYSYSGKYLVTMTGRYDGSSRFSENHKYGFFPSGALAWKVSQESFMQNIKSVSNLKIRASYGLSGNQAIPDYQTLGVLQNTNVILNNNPVTGYYLNRLPNNNLKWETTSQLDLGVDLGLLNDRLQLTADYYDKKTRDLLLNVTLPTSSGFSSVLQNVGEVGNKGFEFQLIGKIIKQNNFNWTSAFTLTHNKTKILDLGKDAKGNPITYKEVGTGGNWFPMILGQSMQQLFGYKVLGVYQSDEEAVANGEPTKKAGDYKFDTSPGGVLPNDNRRILSHFEPKFTYGFNNNFVYKNFSLSVLIVGSYGNDIANEFRKYNITLNGKWAPTQYAYDHRYIQGGKSKDILFDRPQFDNSGSTIRDYANSLWIENGSYLRVRDITLAYDFVPSALKAMKISSLQVYISAQNYITITKYSGYDPESAWQAATINGWDRGSYPSSKGITGGIKANF